ncbi:hypothetical protein ACP26L_17565 [Paenibacillus sp. S-38]|uniref:hypothetical protein n=1 Tax=Paenibacillus sp. S-38 TaxID=3416710 RepID=UPI003CF91DB0
MTRDQFYVELVERERVTVTLSGCGSVVKKVMTSGGGSVEVNLTLHKSLGGAPGYNVK